MSLIDRLSCANAFEEVIRAAKSCTLSPSAAGNYATHYEPIKNWFQNVPKNGWTADRVIQGSLMVYGWMPTILEGRKTDSLIMMTQETAKDFGEQLNANDTTPCELPTVHWNFINGSHVGTSKFLHFWKPDCFAIWDINVARALIADKDIASKLRHDQIECFGSVEKYQKLIRAFVASNQTFTIRAIEQILFKRGQALAREKAKK